MAQMSLEELYRGEGAGEKYGIMGEVMKDFLQNGRPSEYDERTWLDMLSYVIRHQDSLIPTLTAQQKETFEKLKDCEAELHGMNEREAFISGFKLAARIMTEVLYEPSED